MAGDSTNSKDVKVDTELLLKLFASVKLYRLSTKTRSDEIIRSSMQSVVDTAIEMADKYEWKLNK